MRKSLYSKFIMGYVIFGLLGFILIATFGANVVYRKILNEQIDKLYEAANNISNAYNKSYNLTMLAPQLDALSLALDTEIWVLDRDGKISYNTNKEHEISKDVITGFDATDTQGERPYYMIGDFYSLFPDDTLSVFAPLTNNFHNYGYVILHVPCDDILNLRDRVLNLSYLTLVGIFGLSLILLIIFRFAVHRPLKKIIHAANEYAAGNLTYDADIHSHDEIGYLSATLSYMAKQLNSIGEDQHKFVANVSHDFRSPLTSIKGYIEAMLDGTIPPQGYERYLKIVLDETTRLNKLTQSLLTLNSFDQKGTYLDCTNFDINHIIKKILATFEGLCMDKKITFDLTFSSREQLVYADMGKIQQVLYNLIDNAIKFSPPDSSINIETYSHHEKVFISVKDHGIGIPRESLKKIWDRFYKTDPSRGKDKKGTGLGLSITKEIILAHNENIDVISTEGVGTEFIFSLPMQREGKK